MNYDVIERNGVVELVEAEKGKYKSPEEAEVAADKLIASNEAAEIAQQDKEDEEAERASNPKLMSPLERMLRFTAPGKAAKETSIPELQDFAKERNIDLGRTKGEVAMIKIIQKALGN